jgi:WD40 repeat protein
VLGTLKGHQGPIKTVFFASDGKRLLTTSADKTARVWDLETAGAAIRHLETFVGQSRMARFSPDGQLIAAASGRRLRLWDAATGRVVRELSAGDQGVLQSVAFSPTDRRLLAVGYYGQQDNCYFALWDIDAAAERARLPVGTDSPGFRADKGLGAVCALAFSPDGRYLVAGCGVTHSFAAQSFPNPLWVWEVATRRLVHRLDGHTGYCPSLDFSRDGALLASASHDGTAIIWSTATWKATQTLQNPDKGSQHGQSEQGIVAGVAFAPDGETLAMASFGGSVQLWNVATGKLIEVLRGHSGAVLAVAFSPDGRTLASGSVDQAVRLWNLQKRRELMRLDPGHHDLGEVWSVAFSADGKHLIAGGGAGTGFWSAERVVWNDPDRAALVLRDLLRSNADFQSRIRVLSENLRLHEAVARLDGKDLRVRAAQAATEANWQAARRAWPEAARAVDRLVAADTAEPDAWLRTPGLFRVAAALLNENRPSDAARLLRGASRRLSQDGYPTFSSVGVIFAQLSPLQAALASRLAELPRDAGLLDLRAVLAESDPVRLLAKASADHPKDTVLSLNVAALQAWFGQEKELAATRQRILAFAQDTDDMGTAMCAARACSILPSADNAERDRALALARRAVHRGPGNHWCRLALGMAEYRSAHFALAEAALLDPGSNYGGPQMTPTFRFYRAMSLHRQGKKDEARKLAIAAAAKMKPLPEDENDPLGTVDANEYLDTLIMCLAYKEAKATIQFDAGAPSQAETEEN